MNTPKITEIQPETIHYVTTKGDDFNEYIRHSATNWSVRMGESHESVYDCAELEAAFQASQNSEKEVPDEYCSACRYYIPYVNGEGDFIYGECHRNPPTSQRVPAMHHRDMFPVVFDYVTNWPRMDQQDSCGCFEPFSES